MNDGKVPQADTSTCTYSDLQDQLTTLNYPFQKNGISLAATVEDNPNWVTLTGDRVRRSYPMEGAANFSR